MEFTNSSYKYNKSDKYFNMSILEKIKQYSNQILPELVEIRRNIHMYPELGFEEYKTSELIVDKLKQYGAENIKVLAKTGVTALIRGKNPDSRVVALRADMDALPIKENNTFEYCSRNEGVMHACGHDAHMAMLLGAAKILIENRENFNGTVKLIFQPSEEKFPGGAKEMIKEGVLENPKVDFVIGQHVLPDLEAGKVGVKSGKYMAYTDEIYLTVKGKGGQGATPTLNIDPVLIASHIIVSMQQVVSRFSPPEIPTVLSFGKIYGYGRTNIIPDEVVIEGTLRTFNEVWREQAHNKIINLAEKTAEAMGGSCEVRIDKGYPFLVNDNILTEIVKESAVSFLGSENFEELDIRMTAEDFAYFTQQCPSCFYRIGTMNKSKNITSNLHTNTFDIDEDILGTGACLLAWTAINVLNEKD